jgi:hypothetical protein
MENVFCRSGVACKPFKHVETKKTVREANNPFAYQEVPVAALEVAFSSVVTEGNRQEQMGFKPGDKVYVRAASIAQPWAKEVLKTQVEGSSAFIVVPIHEVILVERAPAAVPPKPEPTSAPGPGMLAG